MLDITIRKNEVEKWLETTLTGKALLTCPQLNKGTAFTLEERHELGLMGKLPAHVETLPQQIKRAYQQYLSYDSNLEKNIFLNHLHNNNQILFYKLVSMHISEMMPMIYTPIVSKAIENFNVNFRQPRGLYIAYPDRNYIEEILDNRTNPEIDIIAVSDGEGVLGIGDQGIAAIEIPIAKLMVYTLCGGINPLRTLPIVLDVGTNNQKLLDDPMYLGWRHKRIKGEEYDDFIELFINAVKKKFHGVFLHWEDFGRENARRHLSRYKKSICSFNDDLQGTGAVTLAALLSAIKVINTSLVEQRIVVYGAGTAGTGISDQICDAMVRAHNLTIEQARKQFWMIDKYGLITEGAPELTEGQLPYARPLSEITHWDCQQKGMITLFDVIKNVKPTVLIGCSAVSGAFTQDIIELMATHCKRPIIFPLSNPTERCEAIPKDILIWTKGSALIATGSPFAPVWFNEQLLSEKTDPPPKLPSNFLGKIWRCFRKMFMKIKSFFSAKNPFLGKTFVIAQCNNALVFPGIGLGVTVAKASSLTENMMWAACNALAESSPIHQDLTASLLPTLEQAKEVAKKIAFAVAQQAIRDGVASASEDNLAKILEEAIWEPKYLRYHLKK